MSNLDNKYETLEALIIRAHYLEDGENFEARIVDIEGNSKEVMVEGVLEKTLRCLDKKNKEVKCLINISKIIEVQNIDGTPFKVRRHEW